MGRRSSAREVLFVTSILIATASVTSGCTVEQTKYGNPGALANRKTPTASDTGDGGAIAVDDGGGVAALCNGAGPIDGGACAKSWSKDIYAPLVQGAWKCTDAICHQEKAAGQAAYQPAISATDPSRAWSQLVQYQITSKRYVDPCTKDPSVSSITCNLVSPACGLAQMPYTGLSLAGVTLATQDQLTTIATWLTCGAPNN